MSGSAVELTHLPPLTLYVHFPWCVRKCPYCDFNSVAVTGEAPFAGYVERLLNDLRESVVHWQIRDRMLNSIFIGGGTPSLLPGAPMARLLDGIRGVLELAADVEITVEANPGTLDMERLAAYRMAGVNRLSIGVQSLSSANLSRLGRIHGPRQAVQAVAMARAVGFDNLNLDLMCALPDQTPARALDDLQAIVELSPQHISRYELTIEPGTPFHRRPPPPVDEDLACEIFEQGRVLLTKAGYARYEISAYARTGWRCRHNLNYWQFGDYLGIGAGAHGKLSRYDPANGRMRVWRTERVSKPLDYLAGRAEHSRELSANDLICEFAMNACRLIEGFTMSAFMAVTGLPFASLEPALTQARQDGLLRIEGERIVPTRRGLLFLDDLVERFADTVTELDERPFSAESILPNLA